MKTIRLIESIVVYGSLAKNKTYENSDIEILLVTREIYIIRGSTGFSCLRVLNLLDWISPACSAVDRFLGNVRVAVGTQFTF
jgi:predicted nucleotidyltransferase